MSDAIGQPLERTTPGTFLRMASIVCLVLWAAIWLVFMLVRFGMFDIRRIPAIGSVMITSIAAAILLPVAATGLAAAAVVRQRQGLINWLTLGCAVAILAGQSALFMLMRFM